MAVKLIWTFLKYFVLVGYPLFVFGFSRRFISSDAILGFWGIALLSFLAVALLLFQIERVLRRSNRLR